MTCRSDECHISAVEKEIDRGFRWLRFSAPIETRFEADERDGRCRHLIRNNYIGILIYHLFLYVDYRSIGDAFGIDLFMHFAVMTPVTILLQVFLYHLPAQLLREGLECLAIVLLSLCIVVVVSASRAPDRELVQFTVVLVVLFAIVMQRIPFWYVTVCCIAIQLVYGVSLAGMAELSVDRAILSNSVFAGIVIFSLLGAYKLEHEQRLNYLLRLRDRLRHRELEEASRHDPLTGLANRRALDAAVARLLADGAPTDRAVGIVLLDIDHFKAFNDTNGHQRGDACLKQAADLIADGLGELQGSAYRFGGEEFLVLLESTTLGEAGIVAERIRRCIETAHIPRDDRAETFVTVSGGVAVGPLRDAGSVASMIAAADRFLYEAKARGRNQIALSARLPADSLPTVEDLRLAG